MNNSFGNIFRITIFGASHAESVGITIEGTPKGVALSADMFRADIDRRRPTLTGETARKEEDTPIIEGLSPEGVTTGDAITITFKNSDKRSGDYSHLRVHPRPSHADLVAQQKWNGFNDPRGGGHFSGRITLGMVAAGVVAKKILGEEITFSTDIIEIGGSRDKEQWDAIISSAQQSQDSVGGVVECRVQGVKAGLGEPFFDSVESLAAHLLFSVPAVKGVEFGAGFEAARMRGSEHNDPIISADGTTATNHAGGIVGGITNGNEIVARIAVKPTASIAQPQQTFNLESGKVEELVIKGRHDVCITLRATVVAEAALAIALADLKLRA